MHRVPVTFLLLAAVVAPGAAAAEDSTRVTAVSVSQEGTTAAVEGVAVFVDAPVVVGTDPNGDASVAGAGMDVVRAEMGRPDPFGEDLRVTIEVSDQPGGGGIPEAVCYTFAARTPVSSLNWRVVGYASQQLWNPGSLEPAFALNPQTPPINGVPLSGRMEDGLVEFLVPMATVGAEPGDSITSDPGVGGAIATKLSPPGCIGLVPSADAMQFEEYVIPAPTVSLGIAPEGTPLSAIATTAQASLKSDGSFTGAVDLAGRPPGTYVVLARACYGESNCGDAITTVTV